ncbi:MAG TPA: hypothetical protein VLR90_19945 [Blastocatellia bacterium]|nr:hypothetical protein [Blastocatellia bacterium]
MNVEQNLLEEGDCPRSSSGVKSNVSRLRIAIMLAVLTMASAAVISAQSCYDECQSGLASCLQFAQGNPVLEANCQRVYDKCFEDCM